MPQPAGLYGFSTELIAGVMATLAQDGHPDKYQAVLLAAQFNERHHVAQEKAMPIVESWIDEDTQAKAFRGYTQSELRRAFDRVADPDDWRAPIAWQGKLTYEELETIDAAIAFYTACEARLERTHDGLWRITAAGYRMGPAGP